MFAKLKKKVENENQGKVPALDPTSPGHASRQVSFTSEPPTPPTPPTPPPPPPTNNSQTSTPNSSRKNSLQPNETGSGESPNRASLNSPATKTASPKEGFLSMSTPKSNGEYTKKLEAQIEEYTMLLRSSEKAKEKLELALEKQQDDNIKRVQDLNEEYQISRVKAVNEHTQEIQRLEKDANDKLVRLEKEKQDLESRLAAFENSFKKREDAEEIQEFQSQEIAKIKHMFINSQEDLAKSKTDLAESHKQLEEARNRVKTIEDVLVLNTKKLEELTGERDGLNRDKLRNADLVLKLEGEKSTLTLSLEELRHQWQEKSGNFGTLQSRLNTLQDENDRLKHGSETYVQQTSKKLEEKESTIRHLEDRVSTLEQRLNDNSLTGDEQIAAIRAERDTLESKMEESRQELKDIKHTWSEKIVFLENQISNLNKKIAEDSQEIANNDKHLLQIEERHQKEVSDLKNKLQESEDQVEKSRATITQLNQHLKEKDDEVEKEAGKARRELEESRQRSTESRQHLQDKIGALETHLTALETAREFDKTASQHKISHLEALQEEYLEKEIEHEKHVTRLDEELENLKKELLEREKDTLVMAKTLEEARKAGESLGKQLEESGEDVKLKDQRFEVLEKEVVDKANLLKQEVERAKILEEKVAELEKGLADVNSNSALIHQEAQKVVFERNETISIMKQQLENQELQVKQLEEQLKSLSGLKETAEDVEALRGKVEELEQQLTDKNKTIKVQQQRMGDLKKTLQRELKVQNSPDLQSLDKEQYPASTRSEAPSVAILPTSPPQYAGGAAASARTDPPPPNNRKVAAGSAVAPVPNITDVNFQYLRHVIFKFMAGTDVEALQLTRAISVLLNYTSDEEKVIKEALEWKMSWFRSKPSIPPTVKTRLPTSPLPQRF